MVKNNIMDNFFSEIDTFEEKFFSDSICCSSSYEIYPRHDLLLISSKKEAICTGSILPTAIIIEDKKQNIESEYYLYFFNEDNNTQENRDELLEQFAIKFLNN